MKNDTLVLVAVLVLLPFCLDVSSQGTTDGVSGVDSVATDSATHDSGVPDTVGEVTTDTAADSSTVDTFPPSCNPGELFFTGRCVPTSWLGCRAATTCDPEDSAACQTDEVCYRWAAAADPISAQALPSCVPGPAMAFDPGVLRLSPTSGPAGATTKVRIEGGQLYIGALIWYYRLGTAGVYHIPHSEGSCVVEVDLMLPEPRIYPVEINYGEGSDRWSLAGFFEASDTGAAPTGLQPGVQCTPSDTCLQAAPYTCSCVNGRCQCDQL